jgi:hypothetical protein
LEKAIQMDNRSAKGKARWAAWRAEQAKTLPPEVVEKKERHRGYHQKWLASLTPELRQRRTEEKHRRQRERQKKAKEKKRPPSVKTRAE